MNHGHGYRKLGRRTNHRRSLLRNLATSLIAHGRIRTTVAKAKALRPVVEKLVTVARSALSPRVGESDDHFKQRAVSTRRRVAREIHDALVLRRLFSEVAPKVAQRRGGYTRIVRVGNRPGDNAPMAVIEFVDDVMPRNTEDES